MPPRSPVFPLPAGVLVLLSLDYLTSLFYYIPRSALAAIIIMAVAPLFDTKIFRTLWRVKSTFLSYGESTVMQCLNVENVICATPFSCSHCCGAGAGKLRQSRNRGVDGQEMAPEMVQRLSGKSWSSLS